MAVIEPVRLRVDDPSGVAPVRRAAEQLADDLGYDEQRKVADNNLEGGFHSKLDPGDSLLVIHRGLV